MANCQCLDPCNCLVTEDGFFANRSTDGRANTVVTGRGTETDPYVISFQQSEFYRPDSGEIRTTNTRTPSSGAYSFINKSSGDTFTTIYQSPNAVFFDFPAPAVDPIVGAFGNFKIVGASATFQTAATGARYISILAQSPTDASTDYIIAGSGSIGHSSGPITLQCTGFAPGIFDATFLPASYSNTRVNAFVVGVWQTTGGLLTVSNVKFWMTTI